MEDASSQMGQDDVSTNRKTNSVDALPSVQVMLPHGDINPEPGMSLSEYRFRCWQTQFYSGFAR